MRWLLVLVMLAACRDQEPPPPKLTCPAGAERIGFPPPKGKGVWCEQQLADGRFLVTRTDGSKWVEGGMIGRDRDGTWTWFSPDGKVAAVREYVRGEMTSEQVTDPSVKTPGE